MTERDAKRQKCIEAIAEAATISVRRATAAFDSLHGLARVVTPGATESMIIAGMHHDNMGCIAGQWRAMSAVGDLTNAQEQKP